MECSSPIVTNAVIGNTTASTLSVTVRPPMASHTARHTRALQSTPRATASITPKSALCRPMARAVAPDRPLPQLVQVPEQHQPHRPQGAHRIAEIHKAPIPPKL